MSRSRRVVFWGIFAAVLVWSVWVRAWGVAQRRFWGDEAWVAYALEHSSYADLLTQTDVPLPPLFGVAAKFFGSLVGPPELGFRLLPMLCGMACVPLSYLTLRTLRVPRCIALAGMATCASAVMLVIWSRELKHYEVETFLAALMALAVCRAIWPRAERARWGWAWGATAVCLVGPWFGYGTVFGCGGLLVAWAVASLRRGRGLRAVVWPVCGALVLALSTAVLYSVVAGGQANQTALQRFSANWYIDLDQPRTWARAGFYACMGVNRSLFPPGAEVVSGIGPLTLFATRAALFCGVVLLGLAVWPGRGRRFAACWVIVPWILAFVAAVLHFYPFGVPRMLPMWAYPMVLAFAVGVVRLLRGASIVLLGRGAPGIVLALTLTFVPAWSAQAIPRQHAHWVHQDFPALLELLAERRAPHSVVYVTFLAEPPVRYYARGRDEGFIYMPTAAGTLPVPGFDYASQIEAVVARGGLEWWILTTTFESKLKNHLLASLEERGYTYEVEAETGNPHRFRMAQLLRVRWRGR
jgi:hypothetical protein